MNRSCIVMQGWPTHPSLCEAKIVKIGWMAKIIFLFLSENDFFMRNVVRLSDLGVVEWIGVAVDMSREFFLSVFLQLVAKDAENNHQDRR